MNTASFLSGLTAALIIWMLTSALPERSQALVSGGSVEKRRRARLVSTSTTYNWFGGLVRAIARFEGKLPSQVVRAVRLQLARTSDSASWSAGEWIAATAFEALVAGIGLSVASGTTVLNLKQSVFFGLIAAAVYGYSAWRSLRRRAKKRLGSIRTRLPFVIDSMALAMESGAGVQDAIALAAESCSSTAIGKDLAEIVADVRLGQPLADSLVAWKSRLCDPIIDEFVMATTTCVQLGAGVSDVLLGMSKRMRERRSHEIETAVGRAQIQLYYPGTLLLIVCMVVVAAPFVAPMWNFLGGNGT